MKHLSGLRLLVFALISLAGCKAEESGDYFQFDGRLFVFNYRVANAYYLVNIKRLRTIGPGLVAVVEFDDPAGGPPIVVREKIWPDTRRTTINSPPVRCIVKDKPYKVVVQIEDATGKLIQMMETTMASNQDQDILPDRPLVKGPFYDPNPQLKSPVSEAEAPRPACPQ